MKKILLLTTSLPVGGSERVLTNLASLLLENNYEVHCVLCLKNRIDMPIPPKLIIHRSHLTTKIRSRLYLNMKTKTLIKRLDSKHNFSIIISNYLTTKKWLPNFIENKTYYYLHSDYSSVMDIASKEHKNKALFQKRFKQKILKFFNNRNIIAVSKGAANALIERFSVYPHSMHVIYNFLDFEKIHHLSNASTPSLPTTPYIIHVGRFDPAYKRQDLLFKAFQILRLPIKLVLLTDTSPELTAMIQQYDLQEHVLTPGLQANPYVWIKNAERLILCSDHEALPMVLLESLVCGTPVISTNCHSGPNEILTDELSKWLVPCDRADLLAKKIKQSLSTSILIPDNIMNKFSKFEAFKQIQKLIEHAQSN